jgi:hypothetical protein
MQRAWQRSAFSGAQIGVLACVLLLLISIPIWTFPVPPLSDYVNHLSRMHVIANLKSDPRLAEFYEVNWEIIPNLMMDLIVPVIGRVMNIYLAGQVFTVLIFALIVSGALVLSRVLHGRWSATPLFAVPFLYNYMFLIGVMNYLFGIGLALWALAFDIHLRNRTVPRLLVSTLFVIALFLCHLFALGIYGVGVLSYELMRAWKDKPAPRALLIALVIGGLPFLAALPLLLMSPTMQLATDLLWESHGKLDGLTYVIATYSEVIGILLVALIVAGAVWCRQHQLLHVHPLGWFVLVIGGLIYLAMPRVLFASYMADQRMPIAIAFMFIACIDVNLRQRMVRRGFITLLLVLVAVRLIEVNVSWTNLSATTAQFRSSVKRLPPGSRVLVAYAQHSSGEDVADLGLVHAACLAIIERSALVTTAFTVSGKQILRVRPQYQDQVDTLDGTPPTIEEVVLAAGEWPPADDAYWQDWTNKFDYLYVLFTDNDDVNPAPAHLTLVQNADRFQLYRIKS